MQYITMLVSKTRLAWPMVRKMSNECLLNSIAWQLFPKIWVHSRQSCIIQNSIQWRWNYDAVLDFTQIQGTNHICIVINYLNHSSCQLCADVCRSRSSRRTEMHDWHVVIDRDSKLKNYTNEGKQGKILRNSCRKWEKQAKHMVAIQSKARPGPTCCHR